MQSTLALPGRIVTARRVRKLRVRNDPKSRVPLLQLPADQQAAAGTVLRIAALSFVASSVMSVFISALRGLRRFAVATLIMTGIGMWRFRVRVRRR